MNHSSDISTSSGKKIGAVIDGIVFAFFRLAKVG